MDIGNESKAELYRNFLAYETLFGDYTFNFALSASRKVITSSRPLRVAQKPSAMKWWRPDPDNSLLIMNYMDPKTTAERIRTLRSPVKLTSSRKDPLIEVNIIR